MSGQASNQISTRNIDLALMSSCDGVIQSVGTFGWWAGYFSFQGGGEVIYYKNVFNFKRVEELKEVAVEEDHFPPDWIGISAPPLDRHGHQVQYLEGDVLFHD